MAELFLARQPGIEGFEKLIVIKRILPHLADSSEFVQMFLNEARLAARLNHPNVVQIYDLGRVGNQYFIAMEYINGVDLSRVLQKERKRKHFIPTEHAVKITSYVCEALTYAHNQTDVQGNPLCIVHRDISPQNVLVAFDGGVKLTDFGIAKAASRAVMTKAGTLKGKFYYMSPEQCLGKKIDNRSDIFSAGILLYQLMTGRLPFRGDSEFSVLHAIVHDAPRPPSVHRANFPNGLYPILERSMAKHHEDRYDDALQMQMALDKFLMGEQLVSNTTLIGNYVQNLFPEVTAALQKSRQDNSTNIEEIIDGLAIAGADRLTPFNPGATPSGEVTSGPVATSAPGGARAPTAKIRRHGSNVTVDATGRTAPVDDDDNITTIIPPLAAAVPMFPEEPSSLEMLETEKPSWHTPVLLGAVVLAAICGALLVHFLMRMENGKEQPPPEIQPAGITAEKPAEEGPQTEDKPPQKPEVEEAPEERERIAPRPKHHENRRRAVASKIPNEPTPAPKTTGYLTLDTKPWTEVYFRGKRLGLTPLAYQKLPAGKQKLLLRNRKKNITKTIWIEIRPNQTTVKQINLR